MPDPRTLTDAEIHAMLADWWAELLKVRGETKAGQTALDTLDRAMLGLMLVLMARMDRDEEP